MYVPALLTVGLGGLRRGELLAGHVEAALYGREAVRGGPERHIHHRSPAQCEPAQIGTSIRVVPVPDSLITVLKKIRLEQARMKLRMGETYHDNDLIVCRKDGRYLQSQRVHGILAEGHQEIRSGYWHTEFHPPCHA